MFANVHKTGKSELAGVEMAKVIELSHVEAGVWTELESKCHFNLVIACASKRTLGLVIPIWVKSTKFSTFHTQISTRIAFVVPN